MKEFAIMCTSSFSLRKTGKYGSAKPYLLAEVTLLCGDNERSTSASLTSSILSPCSKDSAYKNEPKVVILKNFICL